jgi:hypothetical protein
MWAENDGALDLDCWRGILRSPAGIWAEVWQNALEVFGYRQICSPRPLLDPGGGVGFLYAVFPVASILRLASAPSLAPR